MFSWSLTFLSCFLIYLYSSIFGDTSWGLQSCAVLQELLVVGVNVSGKERQGLMATVNFDVSGHSGDNFLVTCSEPSSAPPVSRLWLSVGGFLVISRSVGLLPYAVFLLVADLESSIRDGQGSKGEKNFSPRELIFKTKHPAGLQQLCMAPLKCSLISVRPRCNLLRPHLFKTKHSE